MTIRNVEVVGAGLMGSGIKRYLPYAISLEPLFDTFNECSQGRHI